MLFTWIIFEGILLETFFDEWFSEIIGVKNLMLVISYTWLGRLTWNKKKSIEWMQGLLCDLTHDLELPFQGQIFKSLWKKFQEIMKQTVSIIQQFFWLCETNSCFDRTLYSDGLVQERCNSIANALELRLSCTNPSNFNLISLGSEMHGVPHPQLNMRTCHTKFITHLPEPTVGLILGLYPANDRHCYKVMPLGWAQT